MKTTQCERILRHLNEHGSISDLEAYSRYGVRRLASRIYDLKKRGYAITSEITIGENRYGELTRFSTYRLIQESQ